MIFFFFFEILIPNLILVAQKCIKKDLEIYHFLTKENYLDFDVNSIVLR